MLTLFAVIVSAFAAGMHLVWGNTGWAAVLLVLSVFNAALVKRRD